MKKRIVCAKQSKPTGANVHDFVIFSRSFYSKTKNRIHWVKV